MAERLKALKRIEAVQRQMMRLAEARLAGTEREAAALAARAERLRRYLGGQAGEDTAEGDTAEDDTGGERPVGERAGATALPASPLDQALGSSLSRAALRSLDGVGRAQASAERERAAQQAALDALRRRGGALELAVDRAAAEARRAAEARDLAAAMEAWLARAGG